MAIPNHILSKLIYLDSDFISLMYEDIKGKSPKTQFSKTEGMKADVSIPFWGAGLNSQETRSFTKSSYKMLKDIYKQLEKYPSFKPKEFKTYQGTQTVWISGQFIMGEWKRNRTANGETYEIESHSIYEIYDTNGDDRYALLVQPHLFTSNIGSLVTGSSALRNFIGIPARALCRVLYNVEDVKYFVTTPYLIIEQEY